LVGHGKKGGEKREEKRGGRSLTVVSKPELQSKTIKRGGVKVSSRRDVEIRRGFGLWGKGVLKKKKKNKIT